MTLIVKILWPELRIYRKPPASYHFAGVLVSAFKAATPELIVA